MRKVLTSRPPTGNNASKTIRRRTRNSNQVTESELTHIPIDEPENVILSRLGRRPIYNPFRDDGYSHVSDLIGKCTRMIALADRTGTSVRTETIYDNMGVTFAIGNTIHDYLTNRMRDINPKQLYGGWECVCKTEQHQGVYYDFAEHVCDKCNTKVNNYKEVSIRNDEYRISGSIDLTLLIDGAYYLTEIKSITDTEWKKLERPLPNHLIQILFYYWLAKTAGMKVHSQVSVVYVSKAYVFTTPFKEFTIQPEHHLDRLKPYLDLALLLKNSLIDSKNPLPIRTCPSVTSTTAKSCSMCAICFSMD